MSRNMARELLIGIALILGMLFIAVLRFPASLAGVGWGSFLATAGALAAYGAVGVWAARQTASDRQTALRTGAWAGLMLGAVAGLNLILELFGNLNATWSAIVGVGQWGLMFLAFGAAGSAAFLALRSVPQALLAAGWAALVSTTLTLLCGYGIALATMPHMQQVLQSDFARSGLSDPQAFVIQNTLISGATHVLLAPCIALGFGLAGALAASVLGFVRPVVAWGLAVLELLLAVGGVASLNISSSLERAARPPYVMAGLLALGIAMACLYPILSALRRASHSTIT
jgi:hypothetical protein